MFFKNGKFDRMAGMIIEVDEYKKKVPGYDPERSEDVHRESAKLADKDFIEQLKSGKYSEIIFMAGGAASGKTEFSSSYLTNDDQLVYDGTLKNFDGFQIKLRHIKKYAKSNPMRKVVLIMPSDWKSAFEIFLNRERKMTPPTFFDTHIRSKLAVARVLRETDISVEIQISDVTEGSHQLKFEKLDFSGEQRNSVAEDLIVAAKDLHQEAFERGLDIIIDYDTILNI